MIPPFKLIILSFCIWALAAFAIEGTYQYEGSAFWPVLLLFGYLLSFLLGYLSVRKSNLVFVKKYSEGKIKQIAFLLLFLGVTGVLIDLYIGTFITEIYTTKDTFAKRLELFDKENNSGLLGLISSPLYPMAFISLLITIYHYKLFSLLFKGIVLIFGSYGLFKTFFVGGRTIIVFLGVIMLFVLLKTYIDNNRKGLIQVKFYSINVFLIPKELTKRKVYIPVIASLIFFVYYSINVVNSRVDYFNYGDAVLSLWETKEYKWFEMDHSFKKEYYAASKEEKATMLGWYSLKHYFAHSVYEYIRLVNSISPFGHYFGQYEFNVPFKFFRVLGVPFQSFSELNAIVKRQAVYSTFFGPFYIDFGVFGLLVLYSVGRGIKKIFNKAQNGSIPYIILYAYSSLILLSSFFLNFLLGASFYYLFSILILILLFKHYPENLKFIFKP